MLMDTGNYCPDTKTNLIINYLPQSLSDSEFKSIFLSIGPIKSCKIVRNKSTGYSYGFGFVDYASVDDAARAISTLNGFQLQNKRIKVAYARPSSDSIKNANLYIKGIPKMMTQHELASLFAECGSIIQCRVLVDDGGTNKGIGFVLFDLREQAEQAIDRYNGVILPGGIEPLSVKFADDNTKKVRQTSPLYYSNPFSGGYVTGSTVRQSGKQINRNQYNPVGSTYQYTNTGLTVSGVGGHTLFIYNIGADAEEDDLWQLFAQYGTIQKVNVIRDQDTGQGKGYGFVTMSNFDDAVWAMENLNGFEFAGKPLQVSFKTQKA